MGGTVHPRKSDHVHIHHLWEEARTKKIKARTFRTAFWEDAPSGVPRFSGPSWLGPLVRG